MLPLASTRTRKKSCAIIAALGEICGLALPVPHKYLLDSVMLVKSSVFVA